MFVMVLRTSPPLTLLPSTPTLLIPSFNVRKPCSSPTPAYGRPFSFPRQLQEYSTHLHPYFRCALHISTPIYRYALLIFVPPLLTLTPT